VKPNWAEQRQRAVRGGETWEAKWEKKRCTQEQKLVPIRPEEAMRMALWTRIKQNETGEWRGFDQNGSKDVLSEGTS
jgi:hypothetical protein